LLDTLTSILRYLREVPLAWFLLGLGVAQLGLLVSKRLPANTQFLWLRRCAFAAGLFVLCAYLAINLDSLRSFLIQQDEANIISISAATLRGLPMYHPPVSPDYSYSLMYGPNTFLIYTVPFVLGGVHHFWIMRGAIVLAAFSVCAALFFLLRRYLSASNATALLAFPVSALLQRSDNSLSIRADIWIVLFSAIAILSTYLETETLAILLAGICGGIVVGLKITSSPALLFPLLLLYRKFGPRAAIYSLLTIIAVSFAPFALPNISFHNYIAWILFTRSEGLSVVTVLRNLLFAIFLISPCLILELYVRRFHQSFRQRIPELLIILLCLVLAVLTSKTGSGQHYLWHIIPCILFYIAGAARDVSQTSAEDRTIPIYYIVIACTVFACGNIPRAYGYAKIALMPPGVAVARKSIDKFLHEYRNHSSIQMGYGSVDGDYLAEVRYALIAKGQPYTIEGNTARFETKMLPFPVNVLKNMKNCKDDVWLLPHAQTPFNLWIFPDTLNRTFVQNYRVDTTDGVYDAWVCNRAMAH